MDDMCVWVDECVAYMNIYIYMYVRIITCIIRYSCKMPSVNKNQGIHIKLHIQRVWKMLSFTMDILDVVTEWVPYIST